MGLVGPSTARSRLVFSSAAAIIAVVVLAAILRMLFLSVQSFSVDEGTSVAIARLPWPQFTVTLLHGEANMALYYVLLRFWMYVGQNDFPIRLLSVLFSVATVPVVYLLGDRLFGRRAGFTAALLLAFNAFHIRYAQEARGYSLVVLLVSLASLTFVSGIQGSTRRAWAPYTLTAVLAVYSHAFAVFALAAHWASLILLPRRDVPWKALLTSSAVIALLVLPFGVMLVAGDQGQVSWIPRPTLASLPGTLGKLTGANDSVAPLTRRLLLLPSIVLMTGALGLAAGSWRLHKASVNAWRYGFPVVWLFLPLLLAYAVSLVKPILMPRYLIICVPPLVLLLGAAVCHIRSPWVLAGSLAIVVASTATEAAYYYQYNQKEDWRGATRYILSHARPGDAVVFYAVGKSAFDYYREQSRAPQAGIALAEYALPRDAAVLSARHQFDLGFLRVLRHSRVWLVLDHDRTLLRTTNGTISREPLAQALQQALAHGHVLLIREGFHGDISVLLYTRGAAAGPSCFSLACDPLRATSYAKKPPTAASSRMARKRSRTGQIRRDTGARSDTICDAKEFA
jgi:mannosyltransferase